MNAKDFLDLYGKEKATEVAEKAGTNYRYFYQMSRGTRRPSVELAQRLITASDNKLDFVSLLKAKRDVAA